jgi:hypothetical protein
MRNSYVCQLHRHWEGTEYTCNTTHEAFRQGRIFEDRHTDSSCYADLFLTIIRARDFSRLVTDAEQRRGIGMKGVTLIATPVYLDNTLFKCILPDMYSHFSRKHGEGMKSGWHGVLISSRLLDAALHIDGGCRRSSERGTEDESAKIEF